MQKSSTKSLEVKFNYLHLYLYIYNFFLSVDHDQVEIISGGLTFENKWNLPY